MSQVSAGTDPLRIVLFGLPRAGKSALLAALMQSQETQSALLGGTLEDLTGTLVHQKELYYDHNEPQPTASEVVRYPLRLQGKDGPVDVEIIDCDGRIVLDKLKKQASISEAAGALPEAILEADALLLVTDVALKPELTDRVLHAFHEFLRRHERERGERTDVVGLPVFLVLTKCDLLAQENDGLSAWMGRIEEHKRRSLRRLQGFLQDPEHHRPWYFGRLDVNLWATAIRRPPLGSQAAKPKEPFGVAELFRQAIDQAAQYRARQERADRRLGTAVRTISGIAGALVVVAGFLFSGLNQREPDELRERVQRLMVFEGSSLRERLHDWPAELKDRLRELESIRQDSGFGNLPDEMKEYVDSRIFELKGNRAEGIPGYIEYLEDVLAPRVVVLPRTEAALKQQEEVLEELRPAPPKYPAEWEDTGAGRLWKNRMRDLALLRTEAARTSRWYRELYDEGQALRQFRLPPRSGEEIEWTAWEKELERYLERTRQSPPALVSLPEESLINATTLLRFASVRQARESVFGFDYGRVRRPGVVQELQTTRDVATALGLIPESPLRPDTLDLLDERVTEAGLLRRWRQLTSHPVWAAAFLGQAAPGPLSPLQASVAFPPGTPPVPPYPYFYTDFNLDHLPVLAWPDIQKAARTRRDRGLRPLITTQFRTFAGGNESREAWTSLARWLGRDDPEGQALRGIAHVLEKLSLPKARDPVAQLVEYLDAPLPTVTIREVAVILPLREPLADDARLTIKAGTQELTFRRSRRRPDESIPDKRVTYFFEVGDARLDLSKPAREAMAQLTLPADRRLTWSESRTQTFWYECFFATPQRHERDENPRLGRPVREARLELVTEPALPPLPSLLPALR